MARDDRPADAPPSLLRVSVVYSPRAGEVDEVRLELGPGATLADALAASGLGARYPGIEGLLVGIWGAFCERDAPLRDHDRVEVYRPLRVDAKEARRLRQRTQQAGRSRRC